MRDIGGKRATRWSRDQPAAAAGPAPGKQTLTETLAPASAPVQRKAATGGSVPVMPSGPRPTLQNLFGTVQRKEGGAEPAPAAVHASAQRGIATSASPLPHAESIQRLFGRHDISKIQAHTGADAAASARDMGARAYATGDHVVLGAGSDLHTVAHEAAHVVQQRGGVQLSSGVGEAGDAYEQQADAVADRVVRGESAEGLLDGMSGGGGGAAIQRIVQRATVDATGGEPVTLFQGDDDTLSIDPFSRVQILGDGADLDDGPSKQVTILTGQHRGEQGMILASDLVELEDTIESDDLAQEIFDDLLTLSVAPIGVKGDSPIPHYYPKEGCEVRAYLYQSYLNSCGYAAEKAFIIAVDEDDPLHARSLTAEPGEDELVWYYHVAPIIKVDGHGPMVFDPSLFGQPVTKETWIAALTPSEVKEYDSWDAFKSAHAEDTEEEEEFDEDSEPENSKGELVEEESSNVDFVEEIDEDVMPGVGQHELAIFDEDGSGTPSSDGELQDEVEEEVEEDEPSFEYFTTAEPISEPNPGLADNNDHVKVENGDYQRTIRKSIQNGASNIIASNIRHWSSRNTAPFERQWLEIIKAINRLKWNHAFIDKYAIGTDRPHYYVNRFNGEYGELRMRIHQPWRNSGQPLIRDSRKREEILGRLQKALEIKRS